MRYRLADEGRVLSTWQRGTRMLADLRARANAADEPLVIDCADVIHTSYSFIDEFIGVLVEQARATDAPVPRLANVPPSTRRVISRTLQTRGIQSRALTVA